MRYKRTQENDRVRGLEVTNIFSAHVFFYSRLEWHKELGKIKVQEKIHKHKQKVSVSTIPQHELKKLKYKRVNIRNKRSSSEPQYVEALIVADTTALEFHQDGDIETYLLTIMHMVISRTLILLQHIVQ